MSRQLFLVRHGKSAWNTGAATDYQRPLTKRGRKASKRMGHWMHEHDYVPQLVLSSPALRAWQTATLLSESLGIADQDIDFDKRLYHADPDTLLEVLSQLPDSISRCLVIGHNPGLEDFLLMPGEEAAGKYNSSKLMPTCALAVISLTCSWQEIQGDCASIDLIIRPSEVG